MYILIKLDPSKVLGFTVWTGFNSDGGCTAGNFCDVAIKSFEKDEKYVAVMMYSTKDFAYHESKRLEALITEKMGPVELDIMPLDVYLAALKVWK